MLTVTAGATFAFGRDFNVSWHTIDRDVLVRLHLAECVEQLTDEKGEPRVRLDRGSIPYITLTNASSRPGQAKKREMTKTHHLLAYLICD